MFRTIDYYPNGAIPKYTFFTDFDIAAAFGESGIKDTYDRVVAEWGDNYEAMTEVSIALNLLCWDFYGSGNEELSQIFADYYYKSKDFFYDKFEDNSAACAYYFEMTD